MNNGCIIAIDQGTTNTKAVLVNESGAIIAQASRGLRVTYPQPAWVEQDPLVLWQSVREALNECLLRAPSCQPTAIAISNQRETIMLWERSTGQPLGPAVVWQCHRSAPFCHELSAQGLEPWLRERTGLTIDPMFSATKARWLLDHIPNGKARAQQGELCLGTVDSWLLWNLTGGAVHACDMTNASRTQLFNLHTLDWDPELAEVFGVPIQALPTIRPSGAIFGTSIQLDALAGGIPIASMIGDSHAAMFSHAIAAPGALKATYGTGSSLMLPTEKPILSQKGLSTTIAWAREEVTYALEGNIYVTGAAVQWLAELLQLPGGAADIQRLASQVPNSNGAYLVPAFVGLGAPHWNEGARGLISGLTGSTLPAHLARAALESIAYQVRDVFDALAIELGSPPQMLLADGGASRNDLLMQFQADIIGQPVQRSSAAEVSALGAAWLAGLTVGLWDNEEQIRAFLPRGDHFRPQIDPVARAELYQGWQRAIATTLYDSQQRSA